MRFDHITDQDMSGILAVYSNMDDGADAVAVDIINAKALHQFCISGSDIFTVYLCCYTVSADLFDVRDTASVDQFSICSLQTLADRMARSTLSKCCVFQNIFLTDRIVVNTGYFKDTLCHGTGFIEYNVFGLGKCFQIVGTFHQDTFMACAADTGEEAERNTDDQCTRAADNQEGQRTVNPYAPLRSGT